MALKSIIATKLNGRTKYLCEQIHIINFWAFSLFQINVYFYYQNNKISKSSNCAKLSIDPGCGYKLRIMASPWFDEPANWDLHLHTESQNWEGIPDNSIRLEYAAWPIRWSMPLLQANDTGTINSDRVRYTKHRLKSTSCCSANLNMAVNGSRGGSCDGRIRCSAGYRYW